MQKPELRRIILSQQSFFQKERDLIPRDLEIGSHLKGRETVLICGIRGCGKTSFLKWIADRLDGIKVYINFEDIRQEDFELRNVQDSRNIQDALDFQNSLDAQDIRDIASELVSGLHGNSGKEIGEGGKQVYYFLEEIQHLRLWERWLGNLYEDGIKVFVTFSNSSFLNPEETLLRGRNKPISNSKLIRSSKLIRLFPFSFKEFLRLKGIKIPDPDSPNFLTFPDFPEFPEFQDPTRKDEIFSLFLRYFENGGFPAVIKNDDVGLAEKYFEEILQKEVIDLHDVEDPEGLRELAVFLISNVASEYSFEKLKKVSVIGSEETVRCYLDYLEEAFLLYRVPMLNHSPEKRGAEVPEKALSCKIYAGDTGFFKAVVPGYPDSLGLRFENLVFLELLRRGKEVSCFRDRKECDFVLRDAGTAKVTEAIQVSTYFGNPAVRKREIEGLLGAMEEYELEEGIILTLDEEEVMMLSYEDVLDISAGGHDGQDYRKIVVKPVWKWLLE